MRGSQRRKGGGRFYLEMEKGGVFPRRGGRVGVHRGWEGVCGEGGGG